MSSSTPKPTAFEIFYNDPSPIHALNLAVQDAIHAKLDGNFVSNLMHARDLLASRQENLDKILEEASDALTKINAASPVLDQLLRIKHLSRS